MLILAGAYVYEFLRLNSKCLLSSIPEVNSVYKQNPYAEAEFRFEEFQDLFNTNSRSRLVNVYMLQPISTPNCVKPSATVLSANGIDSKVSSIDVLKRWLMIFFELRSRNIFTLGFSTDGDPKYLRAMRLACNFFCQKSNDQYN